jgi:hypothetical protein
MNRQQRQALAQILPFHIEMLGQSRAAEVPRGDVEGCPALGWMRWAGGRMVIRRMGMGIRNVALGGGECHEQPR